MVWVACLAAPAIAGALVLDVGNSAGAPGSSVQVAVALGGVAESGALVSSAQLDLLYDTSVFHDPDPPSDCVIDGRYAGTEFIHLESIPLRDPRVPTPDGFQRLRLYVGDFSAPLADLTDGLLYTCTFRIRDDAPPGPSTLAADRLNLGGDRGMALPVEGSDGVVRQCTGDRDAPFGEIDGDELNDAIRAFTTDDVTLNPAADTIPPAGDGEIDGDELNQVIRNFVRSECGVITQH